MRGGWLKDGKRPFRFKEIPFSLLRLTLGFGIIDVPNLLDVQGDFSGFRQAVWSGSRMREGEVLRLPPREDKTRCRRVTWPLCPMKSPVPEEVC